MPLWSLVSAVGLTNTYLALILPPLANPLGAILMRQFILGLPRDLDNAARLDGLSDFGIYWRIVLPLIKPGLVVLAVIIFTDQFMSFLWPLIATTSDDLQVLTVGVAALRAHGGANYGLWSASAVMSLIPISVFFFVLQRQFLARSLAGALKQCQDRDHEHRDRPLAIELIEVSKRYGEITVLNGINLAIEPGEFIALLGPSGCGKSTLLKLIAGLEEMSDGEIYIGGQARQLPATRARATSRWCSRTMRSTRT